MDQQENGKNVENFSFNLRRICGRCPNFKIKNALNQNRCVIVNNGRWNLSKKIIFDFWMKKERSRRWENNIPRMEHAMQQRKLNLSLWNKMLQSYRVKQLHWLAEVFLCSPIIMSPHYNIVFSMLEIISMFSSGGLDVMQDGLMGKKMIPNKFLFQKIVFSVLQLFIFQLHPKLTTHNAKISISSTSYVICGFWLSHI